MRCAQILKNLVTDKAWEVGFNEQSQIFYGEVRPSSAGQLSKLLQIDIPAAEGPTIYDHD